MPHPPRTPKRPGASGPAGAAAEGSSPPPPEQHGLRRPDAEATGGAKGGWDPVAKWYDQLVGAEGSEQQQRVVIPEVMKLLTLASGEAVLDLACGQGVLAPLIQRAGARYTGVDASAQLISMARRRHASAGRFFIGNLHHLEKVSGLHPRTFDAAIIMLAVQDVDPLEPVWASAAWALKPGGRLLLAMTHPCFRIPRQSGWGWDEARQLSYRRVDRYLTPLSVPMRATSTPPRRPRPQGGHPGTPSGRSGEESHGVVGTITNHHRPLSMYVNSLANQGFTIDRLEELPLFRERGQGQRDRAEYRAAQDIPQFLLLRAGLAGAWALGRRSLSSTGEGSKAGPPMKERPS